MAKSVINHRERKNGASAEQFAKARTEANAKRGKQVWVWDDEAKKLGHWERPAASNN